MLPRVGFQNLQKFCVNGVYTAEILAISTGKVVPGNKTGYGFVVLWRLKRKLPKQRNGHVGNGGRSGID